MSRKSVCEGKLWRSGDWTSRQSCSEAQSEESETETGWRMRIIKRIQMLYETFHVASGQLFLWNRSYVNEFFCTAALQPKFQLSSLTTYYIPEDQDRAWQNHTESQIGHTPVRFAIFPFFSTPCPDSVSPSIHTGAGRHIALEIHACGFSIVDPDFKHFRDWLSLIVSNMFKVSIVQFQSISYKFTSFSVFHGFSPWRMAASRAIVSTSRDSH